MPIITYTCKHHARAWWYCLWLCIFCTSGGKFLQKRTVMVTVILNLPMHNKNQVKFGNRLCLLMSTYKFHKRMLQKSLNVPLTSTNWIHWMFFIISEWRSDRCSQLQKNRNRCTVWNSMQQGCVGGYKERKLRQCYCIISKNWSQVEINTVFIW